MERHTNEDLAWNERRGTAWVDLQPVLDRLFLPFEQILADAVTTMAARSVLDIGCGTGATTLAIAKRLAPQGECIGIDVSEPMLDHARRRATAEGAANARFLADDAQRHSFASVSFDAIVSRFGVMFFEDPEAAFANIGSAVRHGGEMACLVWRRREENRFMTAAERAAGPLLGWSDQPDPGGPGQFSFADAGQVTQILKAAGWRDVEISPVDVPCIMSETDLAAYSRRMGRVGMILPDLDSALRTKVSAALDEAFAEFLFDDIVRFDAACWMVRARAE